MLLGRVRIPDEPDHPFRSDPIADFGRTRSPISDHPITRFGDPIADFDRTRSLDLGGGTGVVAQPSEVAMTGRLRADARAPGMSERHSMRAVQPPDRSLVPDSYWLCLGRILVALGSNLGHPSCRGSHAHRGD